MKQLLLIPVLFFTVGANAQNCTGIVAKDAAGTTTVQINKAAATSADAPLQFWLSKDGNNTYLNIHPQNTSQTQAVNFKAKGTETYQFLFIDGTAIDTKIAQKTGEDLKITLGINILKAMRNVPLQGVFMYEGGNMTPSLQTNLVADESNKLMAASTCLR
jgi:hypothetical protein